MTGLSLAPCLQVQSNHPSNQGTDDIGDQITPFAGPTGSCNRLQDLKQPAKSNGVNNSNPPSPLRRQAELTAKKP
jgi:hypothetical protein